MLRAREGVSIQVAGDCTFAPEPGRKEMYRGFTRPLTWIHRGPHSVLFSITPVYRP